MATAASKAASSLAVFLAFSLFISGVLGDDITCEQLDRSTCAFAVSSSGLRCVLEKHVLCGRKDEYSCRSSGFNATGVAGRIETDECVAACGLDRDTIGISSDSLLDRRFMRRLCSPACFDGCLNVFDLYSNVAASEGLSLRNLCGKEYNNRRELNEKHTSGLTSSVAFDAGAPLSDAEYYNVGRSVSNKNLKYSVTAEEEAATPNPGGRRNLVGFPKKRRIVFLNGRRSIAEEEEAAAPA
ncbi:hypothetical protein KSP40_PGU012784 [Platanthera guangdongensis]|uniref:PAR1 protein n=1 Tax=Platanthera guangdongensis TaxID=2320717 RepID=A0ABR2MS03_9ASPA